jgi:hypothetical protein
MSHRIDALDRYGAADPDHFVTGFCLVILSVAMPFDYVLAQLPILITGYLFIIEVCIRFLNRIHQKAAFLEHKQYLFVNVILGLCSIILSMIGANHDGFLIASYETLWLHGAVLQVQQLKTSFSAR